MENCRQKKTECRKGDLTAEEIEKAEQKIILQDQWKHFKKERERLQRGMTVEESSELRKMNPKLDTDGLIRSDSRLLNAEMLSFQTTFPIILSADSWVARLIILEEHIKNSHYAGINHIYNNLNEKYWVPKARRVIKEVEDGCLVRQRRRAKGEQQLMAPLPPLRF